MTSSLAIGSSVRVSLLAEAELDGEASEGEDLLLRLPAIVGTAEREIEWPRKI